MKFRRTPSPARELQRAELRVSQPWLFDYDGRTGGLRMQRGSSLAVMGFLLMVAIIYIIIGEQLTAFIYLIIAVQSFMGVTQLSSVRKWAYMRGQSDTAKRVIDATEQGMSLSEWQTTEVMRSAWLIGNGKPFDWRIYRLKATDPKDPE